MSDAPPPPGIATAGTTPGARLRAERERQGLTVGKAAEQLRLEVPVIEALEADNYAALDAPVYARGYLRKYGALLGIPGDELVEAYVRQQSLPAAPSLIPAASAYEYKRPKPWLMPLAAIVLAALVAALLWWTFGQAWRQRLQDSAAPGDGAPPAAAPAELAGPASTEAGGTDPRADTGPATAVPAPADAVQATDSATAISEAAPAAAGPAPAAAALPSGGPGTLTLVVSAPCWIEVFDSAGRRIAFEMAPANAVRHYSGGPWRLLLGNAAAARLAMNGREMRVPAELIARNVAWVEVTRDGVLRRTAAAQPAPREN